MQETQETWVQSLSQKDPLENQKGNQPWILIAEAETPIFWSPDANRQQHFGEVPDAGKDLGQKEKRVSEDEMARLHYWCNGYELRQTLEDGEGQGCLACCSPWGRKESDTIGWLNNNNKQGAISHPPHITVKVLINLGIFP